MKLWLLCGMAMKRWRVMSFIICLDITFGQWSTAGVSKSFTVVTSKYKSDVQLLWKLQSESTNQTLFLCDSYNVCAANNNDYRSLYSANMTSNGSSCISVFTIKNVTPFQHKSEWYCFADFNVNGSESTRFQLNVFAIAETPTCTNTGLTHPNEIHFQINCLSQKVFPRANCEFYINTNTSSDYQRQGSITHSDDQNLTTGYYQTNCTYTVSAAILGPGSHRFRVVMYPNITSNLTEDMKTTSQYTIPVEIYYPKAQLGEDCQVNGFIKENLTRNCTCINIKKSTLPIKTVWSKDGSATSAFETLQFVAKRKESFKCTISSNLNWTDNISFQPLVSYPPDTIDLNITNTDLDICDDTKVTLSGTCFVGDSYPQPAVYVNINNILTEIQLFSNNKEYIFNKTMTSTGIFNISCLANSTEYLDTASNITRNVIIKGPPDGPIIFKRKNEENYPHPNNLLEVTNGEIIICQSKGGYPASKNISLTCGNEEVTARNTDQVSLTINISSSQNGTCECIVGHESECLHKRTTVRYKLIISETSLVTGKDLEKLYIGIGVLAGGVALIIALLFLIRKIHQSQLKQSSSGMTDKLVKNEDLYFIIQDKTVIDKSMYPEYTNVATTMSSAIEAPKNFKK